MRRQLAARQHARTHGRVGLDDGASSLVSRSVLRGIASGTPTLPRSCRKPPRRMGTARALGMPALLWVGFPPGNNERMLSGQQNGAGHGFSFKVVPLGRTARVIPYDPSRALPA